MKVVLDTNVLFAAFTFEHGLCANVLLGCLNRFDLILSQHILGELHRHLVGKAQVPEPKVHDIVEMLREAAVVIEPALLPTDACRDPSDIPVLGTAVAGRANLLVTGDKDLLVLTQFQTTTILSPREFTDQYLSGV